MGTGKVGRPLEIRILNRKREIEIKREGVLGPETM